MVTGATGFVGGALLEGLDAVNVRARAASRSLPPDAKQRARAPTAQWVLCDLTQQASVERALEGVSVAYYLAHSVGAGAAYPERELQMAQLFAQCAERAAVTRIIYLGGVAPAGDASPHLASRLRVGEVLRAGKVPCIELRASMIVGREGASFRLARDVGLRMPLLVLPPWVRFRTSPVAIDDVVAALIAALDVPLPESAWFDLPGPDVVTLEQVLTTIPRLRRRFVPTLSAPALPPRLLAQALARLSAVPAALTEELILGLSGDLLPSGVSFWDQFGLFPQIPYELAVSEALASEQLPNSLRSLAAWCVEESVHVLGRVWFERRARVPR